MAAPRQAPVFTTDPRETGTRTMTSAVLPATGTAVHRCRLFHLNEKVEDVFVEVWDTEQRPYEFSGDTLPDGEMVVACTGASREQVRSRMDEARQRRGIFLVGDWESRGSL
jgi:hypothetical protein